MASFLHKFGTKWFSYNVWITTGIQDIPRILLDIWPGDIQQLYFKRLREFNKQDSDKITVEKSIKLLMKGAMIKVECLAS